MTRGWNSTPKKIDGIKGFSRETQMLDMRPEECTPEEVRNASLMVASHATDPQDCRSLLEALGLIDG